MTPFHRLTQLFIANRTKTKTQNKLCAILAGIDLSGLNPSGSPERRLP
jgi:hypothetical protein